jgi:DNA repair protein RadA/Sms
VTPRWAGRCPSCGAWNALVEEVVALGVPPAPPGRAPLAQELFAAVAGGDGVGREGSAPVPLAAVDPARAAPRPTGLAELDRVLGGGLVPGSVTLLGGEPGVGKSTLVLQVLAAVATAGARVLLVSGEESAQQVRLRAERLGPLPPGLRVLEDRDLPAVAAAIAGDAPELVVVDSIQAVADPAVTGMPGSLTQVRACADALVQLAKSLMVPMVLVGHVTKDGALAGPRALEHLVDTVITVEGDRHHALRLVRAVKHRFGPTGELGLFEMGDTGLASVADPYRLLLGDRRPGASGSAVLPAMEGQRAVLVEVQALTSPTGIGTPPRRSAQGVDSGRVGLLVAVLENRAGIPLRQVDVFCSVVGGIRIGEPAADLALALAVASAANGVPLPPNLVAFGEVGLTGEIRQVPHAARRLAEAARVGFRHAVVPESCPQGPSGMELLHVHSLRRAIELASGAVPPV